MVFETEDDRYGLVGQLRRLGVQEDRLASVAERGTGATALASASAVPFWDEVFRHAERHSLMPLSVVGEPMSSLAMQAYVASWQAEADQQELFRAARALARAARDHLIARRHVVD